MRSTVRARAFQRIFLRWGRVVAPVIVVSGLVVGVQSTAGASNPLVRPHQFASIGAPRGSKDLGALPGAQQLSLSVVLPPSDGAGLKSLLANLYNPTSPQYHQWLPPGQFASEFGPSLSEVASVESWLHERGFRSTTLSGFAIHVSASVTTVSNALGTSFERYRLPSGHQGYLAHDAPLVPESLANGQIQSILGLNTLAKFEPEDLMPSPSAQPSSESSVQPAADGLTPCQGATDESDGGQFPTFDQLGATYGISSLLNQGQNGHGQTIALYELAPHSASDVSTYLSCFGLTNPVSTVPVDGGAGAAGGDGTREADLDIEQAATQAPDASIVSYEGPNTTQGGYDVWMSIVNADVAQTISTSWGECEQLAFSSDQGGLGTYTTLFEQATTQGQSVFAASGDSGSEDCYSSFDSTSLAVDYPGVDPNVTAVGGTTLDTPATSPPTEAVWNDCQGDESISCANASSNGAGGGGLSDFEPRPSYQPDAAPVSASCDRECREVPDVSANSGTYMVFYDDGWSLAKGTSFAAPFWAGLTADKNNGCTSPTGLFNPALYALNSEGSYGSAFNDINDVNEDNDLTGSHHGEFPAGTGYDLATGIGSPIAGGLSCPEVTTVGQGQSGHDVVITGLGLDNATIDFGSSAATVVPGTATDTQVTVVVPSGSGTVNVHGTSIALGAGTSTASFTSAAITSTSLASGFVGTPYSQTLAAVGVSPSDTWAVTSANLPAGLLLNAASGAITGTPTAAGTPRVTFELSGPNGIDLTATLSLDIFMYASTTMVTTNPTTSDLGDPVSFSANVTSTGGSPTGTVTFSVGPTQLCPAATLSSGATSCTSSSAPAGSDTVTAEYLGDGTFAPSTDTTSLVVSAGPYSPLSPIRACDTRPNNPSSLTGAADQCNGNFNSGSTVSAGGTKLIGVAGNFGVPSNATSVVLNVTAVNPATSGFLTVFPTGSIQPTTSNINYVAGNVVPNLVEVGTGTSGDVSIFSSAQTDLVVDMEGYTSAAAPAGAGAGLYNALSFPARICDTRSGNPSNLDATPDNQCNGTGNRGERLNAGSTLAVKVVGANGVPIGATAAVLNVTAVTPSTAGFLTVYPQGTARPFASNVNYTLGKTTANRVIAPLSNSGQITVYSSAPVDVVIDVSGYFSAAGGAGTEFNSEATPVRICDTRAGNPSDLIGSDNQCEAETIPAGGNRTINVAGLAGVPATGATAVVVNLTGIDPTQQTFLTVFPALPRPFASDLNPAPGMVRANLVVATLSPTGTINIYNNSGSIDVVVDVLGWYS